MKLPDFLRSVPGNESEAVTFKASHLDELPESPGAKPSARRHGGFWDGNWFSFIFMLPFILLLVARVPLGISDAFLMGDRSDADYNLWTILSLVFGSLAFVVHTLALPSIKGYGWEWVPAKLAFIGACWMILMAFATFMAAFTR
jgi:hypothetical protein